MVINPVSNSETPLSYILPTQEYRAPSIKQLPPPPNFKYSQFIEYQWGGGLV